MIILELRSVIPKMSHVNVQLISEHESNHKMSPIVSLMDEGPLMRQPAGTTRLSSSSVMWSPLTRRVACAHGLTHHQKAKAWWTDYCIGKQVGGRHATGFDTLCTVLQRPGSTRHLIVPPYGNFRFQTRSHNLDGHSTKAYITSIATHP